MASTEFWSMLFVFMLATFVGLQVIQNVSRLLHTPLMSLTNAISAIAVVESISLTGADYPTPIRILGVIAVFASMTNIVSGFLITDRMLKMFKTTAPRRIGSDREPTSSRSPTSSRRRCSSSRCMDERSQDGATRRCTPASPAWLIAVGATWIGPEIVNHLWIVLAIAGGIIVGIPLSRVPLTAVPQRTALSHAFGGMAAGLVGVGGTSTCGGARTRRTSRTFRTGALIAEILLGFLTFTGSLMAAGKLQEVKWIPQRPVTYPGPERRQHRAVDRGGR